MEASAVREAPEIVDDAPRLSTSDKAILAFLGLFLLVSVLEAYWIINHNEMEQHSDILKRLLAIYWPADRTYRIPGYGNDKAFTLALERVNTVISQFLNVALMWAIVKARPWRHALQVVLGTYTGYGTFLYYYVAHVTGYNNFESHTLGVYLMFYLINAPWFVGCAYMVYDSCRAITAAFRARAA
jgi:hypothetical protein